jgi:hypothetical protein
VVVYLSAELVARHQAEPLTLRVPQVRTATPAALAEPAAARKAARAALAGKHHLDLAAVIAAKLNFTTRKDT